VIGKKYREKKDKMSVSQSVSQFFSLFTITLTDKKLGKISLHI